MMDVGLVCLPTSFFSINLRDVFMVFVHRRTEKLSDHRNLIPPKIQADDSNEESISKNLANSKYRSAC